MKRLAIISLRFFMLMVSAWPLEATATGIDVTSRTGFGALRERAEAGGLPALAPSPSWLGIGDRCFGPFGSRQPSIDLQASPHSPVPELADDEVVLVLVLVLVDVLVEAPVPDAEDDVLPPAPPV